MCRRASVLLRYAAALRLPWYSHMAAAVASYQIRAAAHLMWQFNFSVGNMVVLNIGSNAGVPMWHYWLPAFPAGMPRLPVLYRAAASLSHTGGEPLVPNIGRYRKFLVNRGSACRGPN